MAALSLASVIAVFAVYSRSLGFQFILDDHRFTSDPRIQEGGHTWEYFANYVWAQFVGGPPSLYRPIFVLWVRLNFVLAALSPWGWHFLSIAKHLLVAGLLGLLVWKLLRDWQAAFAVSILFALHPAQTESVSWVTVPDPLMSAGVLGALLLYLRYAGVGSVRTDMGENKPRKKSVSRSSRPSPLWLLASAGAYFAALLIKETAVVFLIVIFAVALYGAPKSGLNTAKEDDPVFRVRLAKALRDSMPFLVVTAVYLVLRVHALGGKFGATTQQLPWHTVVLSWPAILWFYVKVMFWPVRSYSFADPILVERFSFHDALLPLFGLACVAAGITVFLRWAWRKAPQQLDPLQAAGIHIALLLGTLLLVLPILPALDLNALNPGDFLHGRYTYLPLAGLMLIAATVWRFVQTFRVTLLSLAGLFIVSAGGLTFAQQTQWKDDATVFATAHRLAPHNRPVAQNLANTSVQAALQLQDEGRCREAIPVFDRVLQDFPEDWFAWAGRGICYAQLNEFSKAEESLHRAADISHNPQVVQKWQDLRAQMGISQTDQKH